MVGYGAIIWLVKIVRSGRLWYFSVYLVVLGTVVLAAVAISGGVAPMPGARRLWTGPYGSALRDRVLRATRRSRPSGLWIVPSPLARDQVRAALGAAAREASAGRSRVWCWDDLWRAVRDELARAARPGSPRPAARAALGEAIARARRDGRARRDRRACVDWPGFRRRLRGRFAAWTRDERPLDAPAARRRPGRSAAQWAIFVRYRAILRTLDAEDAEGFAVWASRRLLERPARRARAARAGRSFLDLDDDSPRRPGASWSTPTRRRRVGAA